jgi:DNA repair protein RadC
MERLIAHLRSTILDHGYCCERGVVLYTDAERRFLGEAAIARGTPHSLALCPRMIVSEGLRLGACGMILAHSHPSGDCRPSAADEAATRRLAWLGEMVDLVLLDHFIVTASAVYSMRIGGVV